MIYIFDLINVTKRSASCNMQPLWGELTGNIRGVTKGETCSGRMHTCQKEAGLWPEGSYMCAYKVNPIII